MKKSMKTLRIMALWAVMAIISLFAFGAFAATPDSPAAPIALGGGLGLGLMFMGTVDMFATRTMMRSIKQMFVPKRFLLDKFFRGPVISQTKYVDVDIEKGGRKLAPFVHPTLPGKVMERESFKVQSFEPPYVKPKRKFSAADLLNREPGTTIYEAGASPEERARLALGEDLLYCMNTIKRREEWMASKGLFTGKVPIVGEGVNAEIDFLMSATHLVTLVDGALWSADTGVPITNLEDWSINLCGKDSGHVPETLVCGSSVIIPFISNPQVQKFMDKTKIALGYIAEPKPVPQGATYWGRVNNIDVFTYVEWYLDDNGVLQPMVPVDRVLFGRSQNGPDAPRAERHYGMIQDLKAGNAVVEYFPKSWEEEDPSVRWVMVQSAPLPVPHEIDAYVSAKVI